MEKEGEEAVRDAKKGEAVTIKDAGLWSLLLGTVSKRSPLRLLRGHSFVLRRIWLLVLDEYWNAHLERFRGDPRDFVANSAMWVKNASVNAGDFNKPAAFVLTSTVEPTRMVMATGPAEFPEFTGVRVNMLPFDLRAKSSLPKECEAYWPLIKQCARFTKNASVAYLTVHESVVANGESQRRPGLHVESPGFACLTPGVEHYWGRGVLMRGGRFDGGIFMASTVPDSTRIWNCRLRDDHGDIIGPHGDIERLRPLLKESFTLKANELAWFSDQTPHESLPCRAGKRQFFRLVTGEVTAWYSDHSTPNPLFPTPAHVIPGDKFSFKLPYSWSRGGSLKRARDLTDLNMTLRAFGMEHFFRAAGFQHMSLDDLRAMPRDEDQLDESHPFNTPPLGCDCWDQSRFSDMLDSLHEGAGREEETEEEDKERNMLSWV